MMMKSLLSTLTMFLLGIIVFAQNGNIRGVVYDDVTGETLIGVSVQVKETGSGASTDLDGAFSISTAPGNYTLQLSYMGFQTITVQNVEVKAGEATVLGDIIMKEAGEVLETFVVEAKVINNSEAAYQQVKKESITMMDGVTSEKMKLSGAGDAAEAAKNVTGVSVEGGKYVYVRGLGDRYTKTTLNNMVIPGLDPDRNTVQMDIFPSALINNISVSKNFTANLPADFTGGLVNIETKDFPEEKFMNLSLSLGYNPSMHFNSDYLYYKGGKTDWLGFDNGTRELPAVANNTELPLPFVDPDNQVTAVASSFNPTLGASQKTSLMDFGLSYSLGNQIKLGEKKGKESGKTLGYIFSLSYKNSTDYYSDVTYGDYQSYASSSEYELQEANLQTGSYGTNTVVVGALGGIALKTKLSKYRFTAMHIQNGESKAGRFIINNNGDAVGQSGYQAYSDNLEYNQRGLSNFLLNGKHSTEDKKWEVDWRASYTLSLANDPDIRKTAFTIPENQITGDTLFNAGAGGLPTRIWRSLNEYNLNARADITNKHKLFGDRESKLLFGFNQLYKSRDYSILKFSTAFANPQDWANGDPNEVLDPNNIFPNFPNGSYFQSNNSENNPNAYNSNANTTAFYVSEEANISDKFKAIVGVRAEYFVQKYTGFDQSGDFELNNDVVIDKFDLFPSLNIIYSYVEDHNIRLGFSQTTARPSFKELSYAQIIDPLTGRTFNGGFFAVDDWDGNLVPTYVQNVDLRWEMFMQKGQIISVSGFYKSFTDAIELVRIQTSASGTDFQPRNVGDAQLFGAEFELRKNFDFINENLEKLLFTTNITIVESNIKMTQSEFDVRKTYEKDGETIKDTRQMAGQAPWVINAGLNYNDREKGFNVGVFYNVKGETLSIIGNGLYPDVYSEPFHSLNLGFAKKFGKDQKTSFSLNAENILNDRTESYFKAYQAQDQIFSSINPGFQISVGISHKF